MLSADLTSRIVSLNEQEILTCGQGSEAWISLRIQHGTGSYPIIIIPSDGLLERS